jgi:Cu/Ag efflux pump CusA
VAVIGGMLVSTMLSLLVIPVLYTIFDGMASRLNALVRSAIDRVLP